MFKMKLLKDTAALVLHHDGDSSLKNRHNKKLCQTSLKVTTIRWYFSGSCSTGVFFLYINAVKSSFNHSSSTVAGNFSTPVISVQ